jgi:hypothetical protein
VPVDEGMDAVCSARHTPASLRCGAVGAASAAELRARASALGGAHEPAAIAAADGCLAVARHRSATDPASVSRSRGLARLAVTLRTFSAASRPGQARLDAAAPTALALCPREAGDLRLAAHAACSAVGGVVTLAGEGVLVSSSAGHDRPSARRVAGAIVRARVDPRHAIRNRDEPVAAHPPGAAEEASLLALVAPDAGEIRRIPSRPGWARGGDEHIRKRRHPPGAVGERHDPGGSFRWRRRGPLLHDGRRGGWRRDEARRRGWRRSSAVHAPAGRDPERKKKTARPDRRGHDGSSISARSALVCSVRSPASRAPRRRWARVLPFSR